MSVFVWIVLAILIVLAAVVVFLSVSSLMYMRKYEKNSHVTVATVVGQEPVKKGRGVLPVVQFRTAKKKLSVRASNYEKNASITVGQKVNIRYLSNDKQPPQKWDVRIIGKTGYGKEKTLRISYISLAASVVILIAVVTVMLALG